MSVHHVVVDGSNLATEGRTLPSLQQLDEAVRAYLEEAKPEKVTVVVDASSPTASTRASGRPSRMRTTPVRSWCLRPA